MIGGAVGRGARMAKSAVRVLITGASSGIGRALALAYAHEGASLVLLGRDAERLEARRARLSRGRRRGGGDSRRRRAGSRSHGAHRSSLRMKSARSTFLSPTPASRRAFRPASFSKRPRRSEQCSRSMSRASSTRSSRQFCRCAPERAAESPLSARWPACARSRIRRPIVRRRRACTCGRTACAPSSQPMACMSR